MEGKEIQKREQIPFGEIARDLSQGYLLIYPTEGRLAKKHKVLKSSKDSLYLIDLSDHRLHTGELGVTLSVYKHPQGDWYRTVDAFSIEGSIRGDSFDFAEEITVPLKKPVTPGFWREYLDAKVDKEATKKSYESDSKNWNAKTQLNPGNIHLSLEEREK